MASRSDSRETAGESSVRSGDGIALFVGVGAAALLFQVGLRYPFALRVRGDAYWYLRIASEFDGLIDALSYVGDRSIGMPFVSYLLAPPDLRVPGAAEAWVDSICLLLLVVHLGTSLCIAWTARREAWFERRNTERALFIFLASFPAFIGHTTTPLTDTFAVDVSLLAFATILAARRFAGFGGLALGALSGGFSAFAVLLRPSYLWPTLGGAVVLAVLSGAPRGPRAWSGLAATVTIALVLGTVGTRCASVYGQFCLLDPTSFDPLLPAQMGLRGGRLLWNGPPTGNDEYPVLPDPLLERRFYDPCKLDRLIGTTDASLSGCLVRRTPLLPFYFAKKWIGLFDHFRFQPYVENHTPAWLRWSSRAYDALAIVGFAYSLEWAIAALRRHAHRARLASIAPVSGYATFWLLSLVEYSILHPEDRFGLVLVPASALLTCSLAERVGSALRMERFLEAGRLVSVSIGVASIFFWQVLAWDALTFRAEQGAARVPAARWSIARSGPPSTQVDMHCVGGGVDLVPI